MIMPYKNIIFDIDGTLVDTDEPVLKTWQLTLDEFGFQYSLSQLQAVLGITTQAALTKLNINEARFEEKWLSNYRIFAKESRLYDGIESMLGHLKADGIYLGIVTSRRRWELDTYFGNFHFERLFPIIICADDTEKHKPSPEPLYRYLALSRAQKSDCIYIGDMPTDIKCAINAGISSGLALWGRRDALYSEADVRLKSPEDLYI